MAVAKEEEGERRRMGGVRGGEGEGGEEKVKEWMLASKGEDGEEEM